MGTQTKDCSIQIRGFKAIDAGQWECKSLADSWRSANKLAHINLYHLPEMQDFATDFSVELNCTVYLTCQFDTEVTCIWSRNNHSVECDDIHVVYAKDKTTNCSLEITAVQEDDFGIWYCGNEGNATQLRISSKAVLISKTIEERLLSNNSQDGTFTTCTTANIRCPDQCCYDNWQGYSASTVVILSSCLTIFVLLATVEAVYIFVIKKSSINKDAQLGYRKPGTVAHIVTDEDDTT